jgi:predicted Zn finger-like uncharacterized protein
MKIQCPDCKATSKVDDAKIPDKGIYVRCPKCRTRLFLAKDGAVRKHPVDTPKEKVRTKTCPRCGYQRQATDDVSPSTKCPKCGGAYKKAVAPQAQAPPKAPPIAPTQAPPKAPPKAPPEAPPQAPRDVKQTYQVPEHDAQKADKFVDTRRTVTKDLKAILLIIIIAAISMFAVFSNWRSTPPEKPEVPNPEVSAVPEISESVKEQLVREFKSRRRVRDIALVQKGEHVNITIIINYVFAEKYAKKVGDNAVRFVKARSEDTHPGEEIGRGIYNYTVGVYYPNKKPVAWGEKGRGDSHISWGDEGDMSSSGGRTEPTIQ